MARFDSFAKLIDAFGGPAGFGPAIGIQTKHAWMMRERDSVPPTYWPEIIDQAAVKKIAGVTYEALALLYAKRWRVQEAV